jgi:hypothetical protein
MIIDFEAHDEGEWFPFFPSHIDEATGETVWDEPNTDARIRARSGRFFIQERLKSRKRKAEHVFNTKTRAMERIEYFESLPLDEQQKDNENWIDFIITGLDNFKDKKTGKVIECTRENKIKLMQIPSFDRCIAKIQRLIAESGIRQEEEEQKNLPAG